MVLPGLLGAHAGFSGHAEFTHLHGTQHRKRLGWLPCTCVHVYKRGEMPYPVLAMCGHTWAARMAPDHAVLLDTNQHMTNEASADPLYTTHVLCTPSTP